MLCRWLALAESTFARLLHEVKPATFYGLSSAGNAGAQAWPWQLDGIAVAHVMCCTGCTWDGELAGAASAEGVWEALGSMR